MQLTLLVFLGGAVGAVVRRLGDPGQQNAVVSYFIDCIVGGVSMVLGLSSGLFHVTNYVDAFSLAFAFSYAGVDFLRSVVERMSPKLNKLI